MAFDADLRVVAWDSGMERLTGVSATAALGRPCFQVVGGIGPGGEEVCRPDCALARALLSRELLPCQRLSVQTRWGRREGVVSTSRGEVGGRGLFFHVLCPIPLPLPAPEEAGAVRLTARQRQVLGLLGEGFSTRAIATSLGVSEHTARNHVRAVIQALSARSRLEAVARARRLGLLA